VGGYFFIESQTVFKKNNVPEGVCCLVSGGREVGEWMSNDVRVPLVSATGSTRMGKAVAASVGQRLGRSLLELGGNNAIIISKEADLNIAMIAATFGAVGTAGQRCTTTRRLIIHEKIYNKFKDMLIHAYKQLKIGNPLNEKNHVGPLIDKDAVNMYLSAIEKCKNNACWKQWSERQPRSPTDFQSKYHRPEWNAIHWWKWSWKPSKDDKKQHHQVLHSRRCKLRFKQRIFECIEHTTEQIEFLPNRRNQRSNIE
jgi:acyl-CoA reductase-like NAD-dependent aldehyde dehydrogenase